MTTPYILPPHAHPNKPNFGLSESELATLTPHERELIEGNWAPCTAPFRMAPLHARKPRVEVYIEPKTS